MTLRSVIRLRVKVVMPKHSISTLEQKVEWLVKHPTFLEVDKKKLVVAMKRDHLIAPSTYWRDINLGDAVRQAKFKWYEGNRGELKKWKIQ